MSVPYSLDLSVLRERLRSGTLTPSQIARDVLTALAEGDTHHAWIYRLTEDAVMARARELELNPDERSLPLYGIPFAVKDNIDAGGCPTTAACAAYSHVAEQSAFAVQKLLDAGAMLIGKTNLDQFAAGLVGTRSPYGAGLNAFDPRYISGGSSSGSALAVALNHVSFALGTDTAGSGRVPAGYNNIVGLKPTRGMISTRGVTPACRSLDCVSIFALTVSDAWNVYEVACGYDAADAYSRHENASAAYTQPAFTCGVPRASQLTFFGDREAEKLFERSLDLIVQSGGTLVEIDFAPLQEAAALLYQGPWIAERYAAIKSFITQHADAMHPITREIALRGAHCSAVEAFEGIYRLQELRRIADQNWQHIDVMAVPTAPTIYTVAEVEAEPRQLNINLGTYTNFVNLLDMSAIAIPAGMRDDGLPAGVTLIAPAASEALLCELGERVHRHAGVTLGATKFPLPANAASYRRTGDAVANTTIAVVGAHLSGMPLNHQLTERGASLVGTARTAATYKLYLLPETKPPKPGLVRNGSDSGHAIEVELWQMPTQHYGSFVAEIPPPLGIGTLTLEDGRTVQGFVCEHHAVSLARDISEFGGWRAFIASKS